MRDLWSGKVERKRLDKLISDYYLHHLHHLYLDADTDHFLVEAFYSAEVTPLPCIHLRNTAYSGKVEQVEAVDAFICIYRQENIGKGRNGYIIYPERGA